MSTAPHAGTLERLKGIFPVGSQLGSEPPAPTPVWRGERFSPQTNIRKRSSSSRNKCQSIYNQRNMSSCLFSP